MTLAEPRAMQPRAAAPFDGLVWQAQGLVFQPQSGPAWMQTHAQVPTPLIDEAAGIIRVYIATRIRPGTSVMGFVDLDLADPRRVVGVHDRPLLELGKPGTFDEHGLMPSCALRVGSQVFLYYSGWSRSTTVPYANATGLAVSDDGGLTFRRAGDGPVLARTLGDPYSATSPFVLHEDGRWRMWYCSGTAWIHAEGRYEHVYDIKEAVSDDGLYWHPKSRVTLPATADEQALTRPWLTRLGGAWRLWYCHRLASDFRDGAGSYRIAAAASHDGEHWQRGCADVAPPASPTDAWDGKARAYPAVVCHGPRLLMFYNGNGFGLGGFGLAWADLPNPGTLS